MNNNNNNNEGKKRTVTNKNTDSTNIFMQKEIIIENEIISASASLLEMKQQHKSTNRITNKKRKILDSPILVEEDKFQKKKQKSRHQPKVYRSVKADESKRNQKVLVRVLYELREILPRFTKEIPVNVPPGYYNNSNTNLLVGAERLKKSYFKSHTSDLFSSYLPKDMGILHRQKGGDIAAFVSTMESTLSRTYDHQSFLFVLTGKMEVFYSVKKSLDVISSNPFIRKEETWHCVTLQSGDSLYVPEGWLYTMKSTPATVTISFPIITSSRKFEQSTQLGEKSLLSQRTIEEVSRKKPLYPVSSKVSCDRFNTLPMNKEGKKSISMSSQRCTNLSGETTAFDSKQCVNTKSNNRFCNLNSKKAENKKKEKKDAAGDKLLSETNSFSLPFSHPGDAKSTTLPRNGIVHVTFGKSPSPSVGNLIPSKNQQKKKVLSQNKFYLSKSPEKKSHNPLSTRRECKSPAAKKKSLLSKKKISSMIKPRSLLHSMKSSSVPPVVTRIDITNRRRPKREKLYCGMEGCNSTFSTDNMMWIMMFKFENHNHCSTATLPFVPIQHPKHLICTKCRNLNGESCFKPNEILNAEDKKSILSWEDYMYYHASKVDYDTAKRRLA